MWYFLLFAALLGADQLIKYWTVEHLALGESAAFWPGVMRLTRVHNYGAAWSSFSGQTAALAVVTVLLMQVSAEWLVRMVSGSSEALVLENGARYLRWTSPFYAVLGVLLSTRYPGEHEIDLKMAAKVSGNKKCDLIPVKELLPLTGYIRGGCSPIGMKKHFPTYIHHTCNDFPYIYVSAGVRGLQVKLAPADLIKVSQAEVCTLF